jgi:NOL1/NOP2/fmu family ribosome biogenesis protein
MKAKAVTNFASTFGIDIAINPELTIEKNGRFYLVNTALKPLLKTDFFYAGIYLGKAKEGKFFPSFNLLSMLAKKDATRIVIDKKAAWLFICGRDIFSKGIVKTCGACRKDTNALVLTSLGSVWGLAELLTV